MITLIKLTIDVLLTVIIICMIGIILLTLDCSEHVRSVSFCDHGFKDIAVK